MSKRRKVQKDRQTSIVTYWKKKDTRGKTTHSLRAMKDNDQNVASTIRNEGEKKERNAASAEQSKNKN